LTARAASVAWQCEHDVILRVDAPCGRWQLVHATLPAWNALSFAAALWQEAQDGEAIAVAGAAAAPP
jgi:hypothetical protein